MLFIILFLMKRTLLLSIAILFLFLINAFSQDKEEPSFYRNQIGIQLNPYISKHLFEPGGIRYMTSIAALRYGNRITKNLSAGMEVSCSFPINTSRYINYFSYRIGVFSRYLYPAYSRFQIFAEASPYYFHYWREITATGNPAPIRADKFGYYVAPGLSLYTKNKKISFDLYYKFSNLMFQNGNKSVFSYKVNLNF